MHNYILGCKVTFTLQYAENIPHQKQVASAATAFAGTAEWTVVQERFGHQRLPATVTHCAKEGRR